MTDRGCALVTGAGGMSGARIVEALLADGRRVVALTSPRSAGRLAGRPRPGEALKVSACDLAEGVPPLGDLDLIVHTAARSPGPGVSAVDMARSNILGAQSVAACAVASGARAVINFSSLSVYGVIAGPVADETTPRIDPDVYGQTKHLAETVLAERAGPFRLLSLRLPGILGPGAGRNWLTRVWTAARRGETIIISNPDGPFNNAAHVDDLASFIVGLPDRRWTGGDAVTLAAGGGTTIRRAVERLVAAAGGRSSIEVRAGGKPGFTVSSRRAIDAYGYQPTDIEAMLDRYVAQSPD